MKTLFLSLILMFDIVFGNSAVVFMYHRFGESSYPSTNITLKQFQYQLDYLEQNDYNVWRLSKIVNHIINKKPIPPKTVALTIDDAYVSTFTKAYPMLKSKNFPFTIFISTNAVDNRSKFYMTWEMMRKMQENGAEFANHSLSHDFFLPKNSETEGVWKKRVRGEIEGAQLRLKEEFTEETNENPRFFSYPFGEYNMKTAKLIKALGYVGMTQTSGAIGESSDLRALTRFPMAEAFATHEGFITKLNTLQMPIKSVSPREPLLDEENPPILTIKLKEPLKHLGCYLSSGEEINVKWISQTEFEVSANAALIPPRQRYTCTAPAKDGKWYWYSHLWIVKKH
ncbi:MAG: polysaccharide deacetylase family protein [Campylobacterota bacterium]|nr:polysaccharide deacetylase family protein [Campylobacterota bacterium]